MRFSFALLKVMGYGHAKAEPDREEDSNRTFFLSSHYPSFSHLTSYFRKNERKTQQNEGNTFLSVVLYPMQEEGKGIFVAP